MRPCEFPLVGLSGREVPVVGIITIPIHVGNTAQKAVVTLDCFVIDIPCSFNAILGRPGLNALQAVISTSHMMIKFPTPKGIGVARGRFAENQETVTAQVSEQTEIRKLWPKSRTWDLIAIGDIGRRRALTVDTMDALEGSVADIPGIDLEVACHRLEDNYALPNIDELVDNSSGYEVLSFCDAYSGYNQIPLAEEDQDKTAFIAEYDMKLNPLKCTFGGKAGKFLGFMLTSRAIEANLEKVHAIIEMKPLASIKEVQHIMGKIVALGRFLSKSAERCLPIFKILRGKKNFEWTRDCYKAFEQLKAYLASAPLISKPSPRETLFLYIAATTEAVSAALIRQEQKRQRPVYFVSKVLQELEKRYAPLEKLAYAVIIAARRLRYYFLGHKITVLTNYPLRHVLHKPDLAGRLVKWSIELTEFDVEFHPRKATKAQILADFIIKLSKEEKAALDTPLPTPLAKRQSSEIEEEQARVIPPDLCWVLHVDGSSSENGSGAGIILTSPKGETFEYALKFTFEASNNRAEYKALLGGLWKQ
ncbi:hypothetical protein SLEP1_g30616 [Rubroshorea leprosula]|uniref:RNase H type-1 domain-containing protein n=1 Tax=Rubroshorea leprosula TaxID=152421 RepID=A0AAV5K683_9ROSI|nr:hypothetical protein SLEP1_g30616 [Rubroshorea leprosula]